MKKIALLSLLALGFGFTSCDDYKEPNPPAQSNPQESVLQTDDVTVASALTDETYDLAALTEENTPIAVATVTTTELPATYDLLANVTVSAGSKSADVEAYVEKTAEDVYTIYVTAENLQGAYVGHISKAPSARTLNATVNLMTQTGEQIAYVGGKDYTYGPYSLTILPYPNDLVVEDAYYLLGTINGWDVATAVKFNHSGADVYDDPVFTLLVDITADQAAEGWWWKIIPQSTYENGDWIDADYAQYGVADNGDDSTEGMLVPWLNGVEPGAGMLNIDGQMLLTINLAEGTYVFSEFVPNLYTPGASNSWSQGASQMLYTDDSTNYYGYAYLTGEFKFTSAIDWNGINYGAADEAGTLSTDGGAGNLTVAQPGLYWCHVNTASLTYEVTYIETIGLIGGFNGWGSSEALTPSENFLQWEGDVTLAEGDEFKFRANDGWDINLGGTLQDLTQDGPNLVAPSAGTFHVVLDLQFLPYSATLQ